VDAEGHAYVTGSTNSTDLMPSKVSGPVGADKDWDIFVSKLNPGGTQRIYSTRFGGTAGRQPKPGGMGGESGTGVAVDAEGTVFVSGYTDAEDFPIRGGRQLRFGGGPADAVIARLDASGKTLLASTYLGGTDRDSSAAIALDSFGHVVVAGETSSTDFPTKNPFHARRLPNGFAYVARLTAQLDEFVYATYLGGFAGGIAVDQRGNAYVLGLTTVSTVTSSGDSILISPSFASGLRGEGIAADQSGRVWITGTGTSSQFRDRLAAVWPGRAP